MDREARIRWGQRCQNPELLQAHNTLRSDIGQCCLGVLMEMSVEDGITPEPIYDEVRGIYIYTNSDGVEESGTLTQQVAEHYGLTNSNPSIFLPAETSERLKLEKNWTNSVQGSYVDSHVYAGCMNDVLRVPLAEIGKLIEADEDL